MGSGIAGKIFSFCRFCANLALAAALVAAPVSTTHAFFVGGVSLKDEKELGRKFDAMARSSMPMVDDPEITSYVRGVVNRLVKAIPPQPFEFHTSVILHNALNAFAVPGGYVYLFTGMLMNLDNEAELAGVLAHELAHVTQRHVAARVARAQYISVGALLAAAAGIAIGGPAGAAAALSAQAAGQSAMLNYSRADENDADIMGLRFLVNAGYPASGMVGGFRKLRQRNYLAGIDVPVYLSTHPELGDRINGISARIAAMPKNSADKHFDNSRFIRAKTLLWARYGDPAIALRHFSGKDALSLMGRGMVYSRQNQVREAEAAFDAALRAAPGDHLVLREAGIFHYRKGSQAKAEKLLADAIKLNRDDYMAAFFLARLLDETGRGKRAREYYRQVLRHVPENSDAHEAFAHSLGAAGDKCQAYIHLALAAIYANDKKLADRYVNQAKSLGEGARDKAPLKKLEAVYKERKEMWDKSR